MEKMSKKTALVLSGGGSHGSFEVGVLKALTEFGKTYSVISGVSVGALNGLWLAQSPKAMQREAVRSLETLWTEMLAGNGSVYKPWYFYPFNYVASLWKGSLNHTKPLRTILEFNFNKEKLASSGVVLRVGAVSLTTGLYRSASSTNPVELNKMVDWVMASAAMPIIFEPVRIDDEVWVDGGARNITPISDILENHPDVDEIDVILADSLEAMPQKPIKSFTNVLNVAARCLSVAVDEVHRTDLDAVNEAGQKVKINIYAPNKALDFESFDFDGKKLKAAIELGYQETLAKLRQAN